MRSMRGTITATVRTKADIRNPRWGIPTAPSTSPAQIERRQILRGLISEYHRAAQPARNTSSAPAREFWHTTGPRATQQVRNLLTDLGDCAADFRFLARDRAGQFTDSSGADLAAARVVKIPPRSPKANAYAERWVRTARSEVTDRILIAGQRHQHAVLDQYVAHYNQHRPHRARNLRPPDTSDVATAPVRDLAAARIRRREVLGGLIHEYERAA